MKDSPTLVAYIRIVDFVTNCISKTPEIYIPLFLFIEEMLWITHWKTKMKTLDISGCEQIMYKHSIWKDSNFWLDFHNLNSKTS